MKKRSFHQDGKRSRRKNEKGTETQNERKGDRKPEKERFMSIFTNQLLIYQDLFSDLYGKFTSKREKKSKIFL